MGNDHDKAAKSIEKEQQEGISTQQNQAPETANNGEYSQFSTRYDSETSAIWCWMQPEPRPCLNAKLVDELVQLQQQLTTTYKTQHPDTIWPFRHLILASKVPGIYNLGGDLGLFKQYIEDREEEKLRDYAYKCINLLHRNIDNLDLPITMVSLVQGQALGGGFESSKYSDITPTQTTHLSWLIPMMPVRISA